MKRLGIGAILLAMLAGPAFAQQPSADDKDPAALERQEKQKEAEAIDKRYKSTLDKTRHNAPTNRVDPWSNMRGADDAKTKR